MQNQKIQTTINQLRRHPFAWSIGTLYVVWVVSMTLTNGVDEFLPALLTPLWLFVFIVFVLLPLLAVGPLWFEALFGTDSLLLVWPLGTISTFLLLTALFAYCIQSEENCLTSFGLLKKASLSTLGMLLISNFIINIVTFPIWAKGL